MIECKDVIKAAAEIYDDLFGYQSVRGYECKKCQTKYIQIVDSIKEKLVQKCPKCKEKLNSLIMGMPETLVTPEVTTIGQLADRNSKKMGRGGVEAMERQIAEKNRQQKAKQARELQEKAPKGVKVVEPQKRETPWYGETPKEVKKNINFMDF